MILPNRFSIGLAALAGLIAWSTAASASAVADLPPTLAGSYLAARSADVAKDIGAAANFYSDALADDPLQPDAAGTDRHPATRQRQYRAGVRSGRTADRSSTAATRSRAWCWRCARSRQHDYAAVPAGLANVAKAPLASLTVGLIDGWIDYGLGKIDEGLATIDALNGPSWYGIFKDYHTRADPRRRRADGRGGRGDHPGLQHRRLGAEGGGRLCAHHGARRPARRGHARP